MIGSYVIIALESVVNCKRDVLEDLSRLVNDQMHRLLATSGRCTLKPVTRRIKISRIRLSEKAVCFLNGGKGLDSLYVTRDFGRKTVPGQSQYIGSLSAVVCSSYVIWLPGLLFYD